MLLITYTDNKNTFLEQQATRLVEMYGGEMKSEFHFDSGSFEAKAMFPTKEQEGNFRRDLTHVANHIKIPVSFGGAS